MLSRSAFAICRSPLLKRCAESVRWASTARTLDSLSDAAILEKIAKKEVSVHKLESLLSNPIRALSIRRSVLFKEEADEKCKDIPSTQWDSTPFFSRVAVSVSFE